VAKRFLTCAFCVGLGGLIWLGSGGDSSSTVVAVAFCAAGLYALACEDRR
jgi:hypothetical protein